MKKFFSFLFFLTLGISAFAAENLVVNGNFTDETNGWNITMKSADESVYQITTNDGLQVYQSTKASDRLDISQDIAVEKNTFYTLSFDYKATHKKFRVWSFLVSENDVWVYFTDNATTDSLRTYNGYFDIVDDWTTISYPFSVPDVDTIPTFRLMFRVYKQADCKVNLKNVQLVKQEGGNVPTGLNSLYATKPVEKFLKDGKLYFKHGNEVYDITGRQIE